MKKLLLKSPIIFAILSLTYFSAMAQVSIPSSLKFCPKASPTIANCIKNSIEHLRPFLKTGDLGNNFLINGLEPLDIDDINLERGQGFFFYLQNIKAFKVSNFRIDKVRVNMKNLDFEFIIDIPVADSIGDYKINLILGVVNIKGEGKFNSKLENMKIRLKIHGELYTQAGVEYMKIAKIETKVQVPKITFQLHNLFKDKVLNDVSNNLVNDNIHLFIDDIEAKIQSSLSKSAFKSGNQITQKIPFNILFT
ncbi:hypothetical protein PVAND_011677 [Polypedilum vanderplanki]|uniref:Uncharacterized protein n=1 Tax=Polypedilum vanderplanki TaxID=319348 RepID=A0A9J6CL48_POLVA|nr:hypothetical protein PVAND_011677 [Polypedilum vanderplanki]